MTKEYVWAIDEDGKPCKCYAKPENRGKGKCPHKFHQIKGKTTQQLLSRSQRKIEHEGISGTAKWTVDSNGLLLFEPIDGIAGTLADTQHSKREWGCYNKFVKKVEATGKIYLPSDSYSMFSGCSSLTSFDASHFDTSKVTNMMDMFDRCSSLTDLDLSNFDTSKVTNMGGMFNGCNSLTNLDLSGFDTSKVAYTGYMFDDCSSLTDLDISNFDTSNATNMMRMFSSCSSLTSLDVSNFDTTKATNMEGMFGGCSSLTSLDVSNFDTDNVTDMNFMFAWCTSLKKLDLSNLKNVNDKNTFCILEKCSSLSSLSLSKKLEKETDELALLAMVCPHSYVKRKARYNKKFARFTLKFIEKIIGEDLSKEKEQLKTLKQENDINGITWWKAENRPNKKVQGILKILEAHGIVADTAEDNLKIRAQTKNGVMSDINTFLSGVPLEDILA